MQKKTFAVLLSGCGHQDGAEIHEATLTLLAIHKHGAEFHCYAPDIKQHHVLNHITGQEMQEQRNVLIESARIARGKVSSLATFSQLDFDAVATKQGLEIQAANEIALTKLDCLSGMPDLKICVAYEGANTENPIWPQTAGLKPVYESMEAWSEDISHIRKFEDLPKAAQHYVLRIEALLGVPVPMVSVGPGREQMILR